MDLLSPTLSRPRPFVRETGDGPLVICLHASTSSSKQWMALMARLDSEGYRVLAPDLCAQGKTAWRGASSNALESDAGLVESIAGGEAAHVVGHSYGGAVALEYAMRHPRRVRSLALYEPAAWQLVMDSPADPRDRDVFEVGSRIVSLVGDGRPSDAARAFVDYWNGAGGWEAMAPFHQERVCAQMPQVVAHFTALFSNPASLQSYSTLGMPALLMSGRTGPGCGQRTAELLARAMPRATSRRFALLGHMGPVTSPDEVNEAVSDFLPAPNGPMRRGSVARAPARCV